MLQQTQVQRVQGVYDDFIKKFPRTEMLARAPVRTVLKAWQGLGYNRRALNLHRACTVIARDFKGVVPRELEKLELLPGVGPYTARAIRVFAWNEPELFIETNIRRVFIHFFFSRRRTLVHDKEIVPILKKTLYKKNPRVWYWALMDFGAVALRGIPNPNKKSKHYVRQSRFEGSPRYARAKVLAYLLSRTRASTIDSVLKFCKKDPMLEQYTSHAKLVKVLNSLSADGFIAHKRHTWRVLG
jgi:A/G-specific adenine glycosylase